VAEPRGAAPAPGSHRLERPAGPARVVARERHYSARGELLAVSIIDVDNRFFRFEVFRRR